MGELAGRRLSYGNTLLQKTLGSITRRNTAESNNKDPEAHIGDNHSLMFVVEVQ